MQICLRFQWHAPTTPNQRPACPALLHTSRAPPGGAERDGLARHALNESLLQVPCLCAWLPPRPLCVQTLAATRSQAALPQPVLPKHAGRAPAGAWLCIMMPGRCRLVVHTVDQSALGLLAARPSAQTQLSWPRLSRQSSSTVVTQHTSQPSDLHSRRLHRYLPSTPECLCSRSRCWQHYRQALRPVFLTNVCCSKLYLHWMGKAWCPGVLHSTR